MSFIMTKEYTITTRVLFTLSKMFQGFLSIQNNTRLFLIMKENMQKPNIITMCLKNVNTPEARIIDYYTLGRMAI